MISYALSFIRISNRCALRTRRRCVVVSLLLAALLTSLAPAGLMASSSPAAERSASQQLSEHPVLAAFGVSAKALPHDLFLVRTRGELPSTAGIVIHGVRSGVFLVSGDPAALTALAKQGCAVFPLVTSFVTSSAATCSVERRWARVDVPDPDIAAMVAQVNWTGVGDKIQWLVDFGTRYSYAPNHYTVADAIGDVFASYGLVPVLRSFVYNGSTMWNVEATQSGTVYPDSFYVICGHFDSYTSKPFISAPGADDNGTGVAAVLTAAEILTQHEFEYSIRYICFAGEEQGLRGSQAYASWAAQQNLGIAGVLNFDMMGYWTSGVPKDLEIETNQASQWLAAAIVNAANLYTTAPYELHVYDGAWWGDHASFWAQGYAAVNHEEAWDWGDPDFSPYYHTTNDLLVYVDPGFTVGNIQIGVAALATLAGYVQQGTGVGGPVTPPALASSLIASPNPFDETVTFTVVGPPQVTKVNVLIFDALGRRVDAVPVSLQNGRGTAAWQTIDGAARNLGTGVYFVKVPELPDARPMKIVRVR